MRWKPSTLAIVYVAISLAVEAAVTLLGGLRVPRDNAILAPIVLSVPPVLTAWLAGCRRTRHFLVMAAGLALLTLLLTAVAGRLTGVSTGLIEPIVVRGIAGHLVGIAVHRGRRRPADVAGDGREP